MNLSQSFVFASLLFASGNVFSGGVVLSENDCLDILERWAADPSSVPAHLVNHCRDVITAGGRVDPAGFPVNAAGFPLIEPAAGTGADPANNNDGQTSVAGEAGGVDPAGLPVDAGGFPLIEPAAGTGADPTGNNGGESLTASDEGGADPNGLPVDAAGFPLIESAAGTGTDPANNNDGQALTATDAGGPPVSSIYDPCTGAAGLDSVFCWGPWSNLFTAAAPVRALKLPVDIPTLAREERGIDGNSGRVGIDDGVVPDPESNFPLGLCQAGASCGFATTLPGIDNDNPNPENVTVVRYESDPGSTHFVVDPGGDHETVSNSDMVPVYFTNRLGQENVVSEVKEKGVESKIRGLVHRDNNGEVELSAGNWTDGPVEPGLNDSIGNTGNYVWGNAVSQSVLDRMNSGQGVSVSYSGSMAGDSDTITIMTVNFNSEPTWKGNVNNDVKDYNFDAGGSVNGPNFKSDKSQFSPNVEIGDMQGVIYNDKGSTAVGVSIDVTLDNFGQVKDVGSLSIKPVTN